MESMATETTTCLTVEKLLAEERSTASQWWTILNEMRFRKELPDWVLKMDGKPGSHAEMDQHFEVQDRVNMALGKTHKYAYEVWDQKRNVLACDFESIVPAGVAP